MADVTPPQEGDPRPDALEYLRAHQTEFTREALTAELQNAGHSDQEIAAAWEALGSETEAGSPGDPPTTRQSLLQLIAVLLALAAGAIGLFALLAVSSGRLPIWLYVIAYPVQIFFATRWIVRAIGRSAALRQGDWAVTVGWLVAPPVVLIGIMGVCYAYGAAFGCIFDCSG